MGAQRKLEDQNLPVRPKQTSIILPIRQKVPPDRFFRKSYDFQIRRGLALANPAQRSFLLAVRRMPPCPWAPWARKQEIA
jgi:hypothetical protein